MYFIKKTIKFNKDLDNNIVLNFKILPKVIGNYENISISSDYNSTKSIVIRGKTSSRLSEVETYNINQKYIVGVNGVTEVNDQFIKYTINSINYVTNLNTKETTFECINNYETQDNSNNIYFNDDILGLVEKPKVDKKITINRNFISAYDVALRILKLKSIAEIEDYGNNFFNIVKS